MHDIADKTESSAIVEKSPRRLKMLVAGHLLASTAQAAALLMPAHVNYLPSMWALMSLAIAQLILLSFWAGMGSQRIVVRLSLAMLGSVYLAALPLLGSILASRPGTSQTDLSEEFLQAAGGYGALIVFLTAIFAAARRWYMELRLTSAAEQIIQAKHYQFSILHLMVVTTVAAIVLALMRFASGAAAADWQRAAGDVLMVVALVINALCASWAALAVGPVQLRVGVVLFVAPLLGSAEAFSGSGPSVVWWLSPVFAMFLALPSAIILGTLLVVRSCGYRLVARARAKR